MKIKTQKMDIHLEIIENATNTIRGYRICCVDGWIDDYILPSEFLDEILFELTYEIVEEFRCLDNVQMDSRIAKRLLQKKKEPDVY